jgi:hypothetical protein
MVKSGLKTWTMLSGLVLGLAFVTGCNSEETPAPTTGGGATPGVNASPPPKTAGETAKPTTPTAKPEEKK